MASQTLRTLPMFSQPLNVSSSLKFSSNDVVSFSASNCPISISLSTISPTPLLIYCGRGDKKTAKGKRFKHSFGNSRPRDKKKGRGPPRPPVPPSSPSKKEGFEDDD